MSYFKIDSSKFATGSAEVDRKQFQGLAHLAELADRHEDMCAFMKEVVRTSAFGEDLSFDERNLLSVAYKNAVGSRRASWRTLNTEENKNSFSDIIRGQVEEELEGLCKDILKLLEEVLIPHPKAADDAKVFYQKMAGDYYRYLAEFISTPELKTLQQKSSEYYKQAMLIAEKIMEPTDPVRLGLALNYSVCLYEIMHNKEAACSLAKRAFDEAVLKLDCLDEQQYKDGTLILQLLRDNLALWTSGAEDFEEEAE